MKWNERKGKEREGKKWMNEWLNEWMKWMNEMNEWMKWNEMKSSKSAPRLTVFNMFKWKSGSLCSLVHSLPTSSSKSSRRPTVVFNIFNWKSGSLCSLVHSFPTSSSKSSRRPTVASNIFNWKASSRYSFVHSLPISSSKSAPRPTVVLTCWSGKRALATVLFAFCRPHLPKVLRDQQLFQHVEVESELSLQSCLHVADLIFQKCPETDCFFNIFTWKCYSRYSLVHFLSTTFPDRAAHQRQKQTLLWRPRQPFYPKKCRVSRPRVFSSLISHTSQPCRMMWLPWWLKWPSWWDSLTIVRNSEVSQLDFLWPCFDHGTYYNAVK